MNKRQITLTVPTFDLADARQLGSRIWQRRLEALNLTTIILIAPAVLLWVSPELATGLTIASLANLLMGRKTITQDDLDTVYRQGRNDVVLEARARREVARAAAESQAALARVHADPYAVRGPHPQDHDEEGMREWKAGSGAMDTSTEEPATTAPGAPQGPVQPAHRAAMSPSLADRVANLNRDARVAAIACALSCAGSLPVWLAATRGLI